MRGVYRFFCSGGAAARFFFFDWGVHGQWLNEQKPAGMPANRGPAAWMRGGYSRHGTGTPEPTPGGAGAGHGAAWDEEKKQLPTAQAPAPLGRPAGEKAVGWTKKRNADCGPRGRAPPQHCRRLARMPDAAREGGSGVEGDAPRPAEVRGSRVVVRSCESAAAAAAKPPPPLSSLP